MSKVKPAGAKIAAEIAAEVKEFCRAHADAALVKKYSRYFVEGYDAYGVDFRIPEYDAQRKAWIQRLKEAGPGAVFEAGDRLMESGKYEEGFCAIRFAADSREFYTPEVFERIGRWFETGVVNWALCDVLAGEVLSQFLLDGIVGLKALEPWVASKLKYQRRVAPVTLIKTLKSTGDFKPLFKLIEPLMSDGEKVVQQGAGWFLREAWKLQPKPAEAFLMRFKETCSRLIVQYATEKMDKVGRAKFRRAG
ncbi:MAG: DNA alkylation repair protein [Bryobacteraceae bacterium]|jgi:3-methyladenine DNA glycosylase AlkD